jgi:hypothetical protein
MGHTTKIEGINNRNRDKYGKEEEETGRKRGFS